MQLIDNIKWFLYVCFSLAFEHVFLVQSSYTSTVHLQAPPSGMPVKQTDLRAAVRTLALYFRDVWLACTKTTNTFLVYTAVLQRNAWGNSLPTLRNEVSYITVVSLKGNTRAHCVYMDGYGGRFGLGALPPGRHERQRIVLLDQKPKSGLSPEEMSSVLNTAMFCSCLLCDTNRLIFPPSTIKILSTT